MIEAYFTSMSSRENGFVISLRVFVVAFSLMAWAWEKPLASRLCLPIMYRLYLGGT